MKSRVLALIGIALVASARTSNAQAPPDGLKMFTAMMPVFTHARCSNCHGGVNPVSGAGHEAIPDAELTKFGTVKTNETCLLCHDAPLEPGDAGWRLPPSRMHFTGKDAKALCRQMRGMHEEPQVFIDHAGHDYLIGLGFVGRRGDAAKDSKPPPLSRAEFVRLATRWTEEGDRACGDWNGTVTYQWTDKSTEDETLEHVKRTTTVDEKFELKIEVKDGVATPVITGKSVTTMDDRALRPFCGNNTKNDITTVTWQTPAEATVDVKPTGSGKYLIEFNTKPHEATVVTESKWTAGSCPLFTDGSDTQTFTMTLPGSGFAVFDDLIQSATRTGEKSYVLEGSRDIKHSFDASTLTRTLTWKLTRE